MSRHGDRVESSYLGYPLLIGHSDVAVYDKRGRKLATLTSVPAARTFVRGYRRDTVKAEPTAGHSKATAGSDSEGA